MLNAPVLAALPVRSMRAEPVLWNAPPPMIDPLSVAAPLAVVSIVPAPVMLNVRALVNAVVAVRICPSIMVIAPDGSPNAASPDYRVKIDNAAERPDLRMTLVDRPEIADFVLADDFGAVPGNACKSAVPVKTVKVDGEARTPDVTVSFAPGDTMPDYRVYVHSVRFSNQDAAALLAVLWRAQQSLKLAEQR